MLVDRFQTAKKNSASFRPSVWQFENSSDILPCSIIEQRAPSHVLTVYSFLQIKKIFSFLEKHLFYIVNSEEKIQGVSRNFQEILKMQYKILKLFPAVYISKQFEKNFMKTLTRFSSHTVAKKIFKFYERGQSHLSPKNYGNLLVKNTFLVYEMSSYWPTKDLQISSAVSVQLSMNFPFQSVTNVRQNQ